MKYNVYFIFSIVKIQNFISTFHRSENITFSGLPLFSFDLLQCTSELQTPINFLFVSKNIKCGYAFS